mmetsp:Transcript_5576/g.16172  ORF Transcript_5576/g.16172 Transcript_5576/m.16172 type:complete len:196 (-) Transcript_5576:661-1248(-)
MTLQQRNIKRVRKKIKVTSTLALAFAVLSLLKTAFQVVDKESNTRRVTTVVITIGTRKITLVKTRVEAAVAVGNVIAEIDPGKENAAETTMGATPAEAVAGAVTATTVRGGSTDMIAASGLVEMNMKTMVTAGMAIIGQGGANAGERIEETIGASKMTPATMVATAENEVWRAEVITGEGTVATPISAQTIGTAR